MVSSWGLEFVADAVGFLLYIRSFNFSGSGVIEWKGEGKGV